MPVSHRAVAVPPATPSASLTPHELVAAPELTLLVALQQLLDLTTRTLAALHPKIVDDRFGLGPRDLRAALADQIIDLGGCLARAATCYHVAAIDSLHAPDTDDIPF